MAAQSSTFSKTVRYAYDEIGRVRAKTYPGGKRAVQDLSLHIEPGDIYGFIGHNGAH